MTPIQIAHDQCANWRTDGQGCLGAVIDDDLQIRRCHPRPQCLLASPGCRCRYFEECVMPMARGVANPAYRQQFEAAVRQYLVDAKLATAVPRACPACGRPMDQCRRFCLVCAAARRRSSTRKAAAKRRLTGKQLSPFRPLNTNNLQGQFGEAAMVTHAILPAR